MNPIDGVAAQPVMPASAPPSFTAFQFASIGRPAALSFRLRSPSPDAAVEEFNVDQSDSMTPNENVSSMDVDPVETPVHNTPPSLLQRIKLPEAIQLPVVADADTNDFIPFPASVYTNVPAIGPVPTAISSVTARVTNQEQADDQMDVVGDSSTPHVPVTLGPFPTSELAYPEASPERATTFSLCSPRQAVTESGGDGSDEAAPGTADTSADSDDSTLHASISSQGGDAAKEDPPVEKFVHSMHAPSHVAASLSKDKDLAPDVPRNYPVNSVSTSTSVISRARSPSVQCMPKPSKAPAQSITLDNWSQISRSMDLGDLFRSAELEQAAWDEVRTSKQRSSEEILEWQREWRAKRGDDVEVDGGVDATNKSSLAAQRCDEALGSGTKPASVDSLEDVVMGDASVSNVSAVQIAPVAPAQKDVASEVSTAQPAPSVVPISTSALEAPAKTDDGKETSKVSGPNLNTTSPTTVRSSGTITRVVSNGEAKTDVHRRRSVTASAAPKEQTLTRGPVPATPDSKQLPAAKQANASQQTPSTALAHPSGPAQPSEAPRRVASVASQQSTGGASPALSTISLDNVSVISAGSSSHSVAAGTVDALKAVSLEHGRTVPPPLQQEPPPAAPGKRKLSTSNIAPDDAAKRFKIGPPKNAKKTKAAAIKQEPTEAGPSAVILPSQGHAMSPPVLVKKEAQTPSVPPSPTVLTSALRVPPLPERIFTNGPVTPAVKVKIEQQTTTIHSPPTQARQAPVPARPPQATTSAPAPVQQAPGLATRIEQGAGAGLPQPAVAQSPKRKKKAQARLATTQAASAGPAVNRSSSSTTGASMSEAPVAVAGVRAAGQNISIPSNNAGAPSTSKPTSGRAMWGVQKESSPVVNYPVQLPPPSTTSASAASRRPPSPPVQRAQPAHIHERSRTPPPPPRAPGQSQVTLNGVQGVDDYSTRPSRDYSRPRRDSGPPPPQSYSREMGDSTPWASLNDDAAQDPQYSYYRRPQREEYASAPPARGYTGPREQRRSWTPADAYSTRSATNRDTYRPPRDYDIGRTSNHASRRSPSPDYFPTGAEMMLPSFVTGLPFDQGEYSPELDAQQQRRREQERVERDVQSNGQGGMSTFTHYAADTRDVNRSVGLRPPTNESLEQRGPDHRPPVGSMANGAVSPGTSLLARMRDPEPSDDDSSDDGPSTKRPRYNNQRKPYSNVARRDDDRATSAGRSLAARMDMDSDSEGPRDNYQSRRGFAPRGKFKPRGGYSRQYSPDDRGEGPSTQPYRGGRGRGRGGYRGNRPNPSYRDQQRTDAGSFNLVNHVAPENRNDRQYQSYRSSKGSLEDRLS